MLFSFMESNSILISELFNDNSVIESFERALDVGDIFYIKYPYGINVLLE